MNPINPVQLPKAYQSQMKDLLGHVEYENYLNSFHVPQQNGLRINTLKVSVEAFLKISPFQLEPIPWTKDGFYFSQSDEPSKHPYYFAGLYYIQEPSAMAPVENFHLNDGDQCLDLCAAPGGKTLQLSAGIGKMGCVVSNDVSASRLKAVTRNIEVFGIKNVIVLCETVERLQGRFDESFDRILVDAPCSGEGMFRKDPSLVKHWNDQVNQNYHDKQWAIMKQVPPLLKNGGELIYSTCTFSPLENELIIDEMLKNYPNCQLDDITLDDGMVAGYNREEKGRRGMARLYPHRLRGEGHFLSKLIKEGQLYTKAMDAVMTEPPEPFKQFKEQYLTMDIKGRFTCIGEKLYLEPCHHFNFSGLRVQRSGWYLGDIHRGRFEPSAAFALGLKPSDFKQVISFGLGERNLFKYLKCETLDFKGEEGYHLVCVENYPLGFCRINKGVFKNMYPVSWRLIKEFK